MSQEKTVQGKKRPNIIIINPDEMRWDTMGHMGNRAAHTPALDSFAVHEAVSFDHAYCQNPVCVPSRCSFFTGLYPHTRGHRTMKYLLHEGETTLFQQLRNAGYYVWLNGRNDLIAGQITGLEEQHADEIYYYDKTKAPQQTDIRKVMAVMGGGKKPQENQPGEFHYDHYKGPVVDNDPSVMGDWADTYAMIDRIKHPVEPDKPLCMFIGWTNPHVPYAVEQRFYDMIDEKKIAPEIDPGTGQSKSHMLEKLQEFSGLQDYTEEQWREIRKVYLAQCAKVDAMFAAICDTLKEQGIYDDTAIFFLSDHGDFAGDYHLVEKAQNSFEDVLCRVPLLVKPPKMTDEEGQEMYPVDPGLCSGMVELIDFYATAMEYAGVEPAEDHFGRSLSPAIENRSVKLRQYAHCEGGRLPKEEQCDEWHSEVPQPGSDYWAKKTAQLDNDAHEKGTMVTDGHYKFVQRLLGDHELYDLSQDPYELNNLFVTAEKNSDGTLIDASLQQVMMEMQMELLAWYQRTCDVVPRAYDNRFTEERIWGALRNIVPAEMEQAMREYIRREQPSIPEAIGYGIKAMMGK